MSSGYFESKYSQKRHLCPAVLLFAAERLIFIQIVVRIHGSNLPITGAISMEMIPLLPLAFSDARQNPEQKRERTFLYKVYSFSTSWPVICGAGGTGGYI
jgi:hypothetical protein